MLWDLVDFIANIAWKWKFRNTNVVSGLLEFLTELDGVRESWLVAFCMIVS